jgi:hypothetical protein
MKRLSEGKESEGPNKAAKEEGQDKVKRESNGLALPSPPKKKSSALDDLYGDLPPPSTTTTVIKKPVAEMGRAKTDPSKVIFLDVDGVLRPAARGGSNTVFVGGEVVTGVGAGADFLPTALRAVKWLVYQTGARIILSTEWRRQEPLVTAVNTALQNNGLPPCRP